MSNSALTEGVGSTKGRIIAVLGVDSAAKAEMIRTISAQTYLNDPKCQILYAPLPKGASSDQRDKLQAILEANALELSRAGISVVVGLWSEFAAADLNFDHTAEPETENLAPTEILDALEETMSLKVQEFYRAAHDLEQLIDLTYGHDNPYSALARPVKYMPVAGESLINELVAEFSLGTDTSINFERISREPLNEVKLLSLPVFLQSGLSYSQTLTELADAQISTKLELLGNYLDKNDLLMPSLTFSAFDKYSTLSRIAKLDGAEVAIQVANPRNGYDIPDEMVEPMLTDSLETLYDESYALFSQLQSYGSDVAQAVCLGGHRTHAHIKFRVSRSNVLELDQISPMLAQVVRQTLSEHYPVCDAKLFADL